MSGKQVAAGVGGAAVGFLIGGPVGAVALGSAGFSAAAAVDGADKMVDAAKENQNLANGQANELDRRAKDNYDATMRDADVFKGEQIGATVRGGVDVSSTSSLVAMENAHADFVRTAYNAQRDANLEATRIRAQAQNEVDAAKKQREATQISSAIGVLSAGAQVYANSYTSKAADGGAPKGGYSDSFKQTGVRTHRYASPNLD